MLQLLLASAVHCNDSIPKIRNKYSNRNKTARSESQFPLHVPVSDLYIPTIGLPIFCCRKIDGTIVGIYKALTEI
jgi:hypothetical protein